jgi:hypothetical protein
MYRCIAEANEAADARPPARGGCRARGFIFLSAEIFVMVAPAPGHAGERVGGKDSAGSGAPLYADRLVSIDGESITFYHYSILSSRGRRVPFSEIERITVREPELATGKWRLAGSSDLVTWFPLDWDRPSRDAIFLLELKGSRRRIGFTVEDSARVAGILRELGLLAGGSSPGSHA